jgi:hypothetical protein
MNHSKAGVFIQALFNIFFIRKVKIPHLLVKCAQKVCKSFDDNPTKYWGHNDPQVFRSLLDRVCELVRRLLPVPNNTETVTLEARTC